MHLSTEDTAAYTSQVVTWGTLFFGFLDTCKQKCQKKKITIFKPSLVEKVSTFVKGSCVQAPWWHSSHYDSW